MISPRRNENSAASFLFRPKRIAATMVIIEREVPGHMAMHCAKPMRSAICHVTDVMGLPTGFLPASFWSFCDLSMAIISHAPTKSAPTTGHGPKRWSLICLWNIRPSTAAGMKAMKRLMRRRSPSGFFPREPCIIWRTRLRYKPRTATMAPAWMMMLKESTASFCAAEAFRPSHWETRMRCPVEDTGRYSVNPSTMPRMRACHQVMASPVYFGCYLG